MQWERAPILDPIGYPQQLAEETLLICVWAHEEAENSHKKRSLEIFVL
jgi:hypothetical protein